MALRRLLLAGALLLSAGSVGCQRYLPLPLDAAAVARALAAPERATLRVQARDLKHPLLKPVEIGTLDGLSPDEAAVLAVLLNPSLRAVRDGRGVAAAQVLEAGLLPNPSLSADATFPINGPPGEVAGYSLGLAWDLIGLRTRKAKRDAANAEAASVELDIAWQEWQVAQAAKTAAYRCASLEAQLAKAEEVESRLQEGFATIKSAVERQFRTALDLAAAEAALREAHMTVLDLRRDLRKERLALCKALGLPPGAPVAVQKGIQPPSKLALPPASELLSGLEERRLDLVALRRGYESQEATVRAAVLAQFPKLELGATGSRDTGKFYTVGPTLAADLPLFNRNQGTIAAEKATRQKLFDEYVLRVFEARSEIATLLEEIGSVTQKIAYAEESVPVLDRLVKTCEAALPAGAVDILSYYTAQNDLAKEMIEILKLKQELIELRIGIELASGRYLMEPESGRGGAAAPAPAQSSEVKP